MNRPPTAGGITYPSNQTEKLSHPETKLSELDVQIDSLLNASEAMEHVMGNLRARLEPVLAPSINNPKETGIGASMPVDTICPAADRIRNISFQVQRLAQQGEELLKYLQV